MGSHSGSHDHTHIPTSETSRPTSDNHHKHIINHRHIHSHSGSHDHTHMPTPITTLSPTSGNHHNHIIYHRHIRSHSGSHDHNHSKELDSSDNSIDDCIDSSDSVRRSGRTKGRRS